MSLQDVQIFNHRHYKTIRNICLVVIALALFIVPGVLQIQRLDRQTIEIKGLTKQVKDLTQSNVDLSNQNIDLNQKNINHTDCVAKIFAQYTKDFVPITFSDLDTCSINAGTSDSSSPNTVSSLSSPSKTPTSSSLSVGASSTSPSSSSSSSSQNSTPNPTPQPSISQRVINFVKRLF